MTAMYMGAGYLGGSWLFINAIFGVRWHRIAGGFLPITTFTWFMMLATFLHWDRFSNNLGFYLWLVLYVVTPFLVPALWNHNRKTDSGEPEPNDILIHPAVLLILKLIALGSLTYAAGRIHQPEPRHQHLAVDPDSPHRPRHVRMGGAARRGRVHHVQREALERMEDPAGEHRHLARAGLRRRVHEPIRFQNGTGQLVHARHRRDGDWDIRLLPDDGNEKTSCKINS
jgi:hypothetical protein